MKTIDSWAKEVSQVVGNKDAKTYEELKARVKSWLRTKKTS